MVRLKHWTQIALTAMSLTLGGAAMAQDAGAPMAPVAPAHPIEGVWRTKLLSEVTIAPCPEGLCGYLSKIVVPSEGLTPEELAAAQAMPVEEMFDFNNKDPQLRQRPMQGLQLVTLTHQSKPGIYDGSVYNPQDGNIYAGYIEMVSLDTIRLNGCVMFNVICQGEDWLRVPAEELEARALEEAAAQ